MLLAAAYVLIPVAFGALAAFLADLPHRVASNRRRDAMGKSMRDMLAESERDHPCGQ